MSHSSEHGTSSGDLNTEGNLSESSFLEALFGLEFGHADFTEFHRFLPYAGWDFASNLQISCYSLVVSRKKRIFAAELNV